MLSIHLILIINHSQPDEQEFIVLKEISGLVGLCILEMSENPCSLNLELDF